MSTEDLANPLLADLGITLSEWSEGRAVFEMPVLARHLNRQGTLQGGVIATLLDAACGYSALSPTGDPDTDGAVTLMLSISYHARVDAGVVRAVGKVTRAGRSIYFSQGELFDEQGGLVATAQGTFKRNAGRPLGIRK
ncbi:PaaI family thioesterase [Roseateles sp. P5_E11]